MSEQKYRCQICELVIKTTKNPLEQLKHIRTNHNEVYELHKDSTDSNDGYHVEFLDLNVLKGDEETKIEYVMSKDTGELSSEDEIVKSTVGIDSPVMIRRIKQDYATEKAEPSRRKSWVWKYFSMLSNLKYRCNLCNSALSIKGCHSRNLFGHVKALHPNVYKSEKGRSKYSNQPNIKSDKRLRAIKALRRVKEPDKTNDKKGMKHRRSWVWSYFDRVSSEIAQCRLCGFNMSIVGGATGNLNRHLSLKHDKNGGDQLPKWISLYFIKMSAEKHRCQICDLVIETAEKPLEQLKHIKTNHNEVYELHKDSTDSIEGYRVEFLDLNVLKGDEETKIEYVMSKDTVELSSEDELVKSTVKGVDSSVIIKRIKQDYATEKAVPSRRKSWVWKYFSMLSNLKYRCNLCNSALSIKGCSRNLFRHVKVLHPNVYKSETAISKDSNPPSVKSDKRLRAIKDVRRVKEPDKTNDKTDMKHRRSWVWSYFDRVSSEIAHCRLCGFNMSIVGSATGNLNRHLNMKHNKTGGTFISKGRKSWKWIHFDHISNTLVRCKLCDRMINCGRYATGNLNRHLKMFHKKAAETSLKKRQSWVWSYFIRKTPSVALCKLCNRKFSSAGNATGNLNRHLKIIHKKTGDENSWVWKIFDTGDDGHSCKMCQYKCKNYRDVDITVVFILRHLEREHGIISKDQIIDESESNESADDGDDETVMSE